jgi:hypothetical protein
LFAHPLVTAKNVVIIRKVGNHQVISDKNLYEQDMAEKLLKHLVADFLSRIFLG